MAPEILRYEKYDAKADLWSVGAVLYEMCVGRPPFRAQNHLELLKRIEHARNNIKFPDEDPSAPQVDSTTGQRIKPVPADIKQLIRSLLKRQPVERASFEDFFSSLALAKSKPQRPSKPPHSTDEPSAPSTSAASSPPKTLLEPLQPAANIVSHVDAPASDVPTRRKSKGSRSPSRNGRSKGKEREQVSEPEPVPAPQGSRPPEIPAAHRVIPKEVLDPKALIPPSPFDFRGRARKASADQGVVSGPESPRESPVSG